MRKSAKQKRRRRATPPASIFTGTAERWWLNASINWFPGSLATLNAVAEGYLQAANHLGRAISSSRRVRRLTVDMCIYPFIFLWRHYFELRLKELLITLSALYGEKRPALTGHDLGTLWGQLRPLMRKTGVPDRALKRADRMFRDFAKVDPSSEAFRYHEGKTGKRLAAGVTQVNIPAAHTAMKQVSDMLENVSFGASVELKDSNAMEAYYS